MLHVDTDAPRVLNGTAAAIWRLVDGRRNLDEIVALLREEFDDPDDLLANHVGAFFRSLRAEELIEPVLGEGDSPAPELSGGSE